MPAIFDDLCRHDEIKEDCNACKIEAAVDRYDDERKGGTLSVADDTMDTMVQRASAPSLATLFQRGKDAGLLKPTQGYDGGA
jgi:hypothetical protein